MTKYFCRKISQLVQIHSSRIYLIKILNLPMEYYTNYASFVEIWPKMKFDLIEIYKSRIEISKKENYIYTEQLSYYIHKNLDPYKDIKTLTILFKIDEQTSQITSRMATEDCFFKYLNSYMKSNNALFLESAKFIWIAIIYNTFTCKEKDVLHYYCVSNDETLLESIRIFKSSKIRKAYSAFFKDCLYTERFIVNVSVMYHILAKDLISNK